MNENNLIKVKLTNSQSTGYLFKSYDEKKSLVITSRHSICTSVGTCNDHSGHPSQFRTEDVEFFHNGNKIGIEKIYIHTTKDIAIVCVDSVASDSLFINEQIESDKYYASGFIKTENEPTGLVLEAARKRGSLILFRESSPTPNLEEKKDSFDGMSGSVVFTESNNRFGIFFAKALIVLNETHNDFGAENLEDLDFDEINAFFDCKVFCLKEDLLKDSFKYYENLNAQWLNNIFQDEAKAKYYFRQSLTPINSNFPQLLLRRNLIDELSQCIKSRNIIFILGDEGVGKTWITAQFWLTLEEKPFFVFFTAHDFIDTNYQNQSFRDLIIEKMIKQSGYTFDDNSIKIFNGIFEVLKRKEKESDIKLLLVIDGINQKPSVNWGQIIDLLVMEYSHYAIKTLVTSRTIFFKEKVKRKIINNDYGELLVLNWSLEERNKILELKNIDFQYLSHKVANSLLNPRLLNIAINLFDANDIKNINELDVNRILFEHIRLLEKENIEPVEYRAFIKDLQNHALSIIEKLEEKNFDDIKIFEQDLEKVADGRFFKSIEGDSCLYEINEEGLPLALSFAIISNLKALERNNKDVEEGLAKIIDPINALDRTSEIIMSCLTVITVEQELYSIKIFKALVKCLLNLQNTDDDFFDAFARIIQSKVSESLNVMEDLCLCGGNQSNLDWLLMIFIKIDVDDSAWITVSDSMKTWLKYYSLSVEKNIGYYSDKDDPSRLEAIEKKKNEIEDKLANLTSQEKSKLTYFTQKSEDIDILSLTVFRMLAGKPLNNFVSSFLDWSFAHSLNPSYQSVDKEFKDLIKFNTVDWLSTHEDLTSNFNPDNNLSNVSKWAIVRLLYATGDSNDAILAKSIIKAIRGHRDNKNWRSIENYCDTDPCDPQSPTPNNISNALQAIESLDISNVYNSRFQTSENLLLDRILRGLARFSPNEIIELYRKLILDILNKSGYALRYGLINIYNHNALLKEEHISKVFDIFNHQDELLKGLTNQDSLFVKNYLRVLIAPFLKPTRQFELLVTFSADDNVFINLLETMDSIELEDIDLFVSQNSEENQILNFLFYANIKNLPLTNQYKNLLNRLIKHENYLIRIEVFKTILFKEDMELLQAFLNEEWNFLDERNQQMESFYGSLVYLLAIKLNLVDEDQFIRKINPIAFGEAFNYVSTNGLSLISNLLDKMFEVILVENIQPPEMPVTEVLSDDSPIRTLSIDSLISHNQDEKLKFVSETDEEFQERQERNYKDFEKYRELYKSKHIDLIIYGMLPKAFEKIVNSNLEIKEKWFTLFVNLSEKAVGKFYNYIILLASIFSETDINKAKRLWGKVKDNTPYMNVKIGSEKIPLEMFCLWHYEGNDDLDTYRFDLLDKATSDEQINEHVLSAIINGNESSIEKYIQTKLARIEPAQKARGLIAAGYLDKNEFSENILNKYSSFDGIMGAAYRTAKYIYERNIWARHWYLQASSASTYEDFWINMVLLTKVVDMRFYQWRNTVNDNNKSSLYEKFHHSFDNEILRRCEKWQESRDKKLFGLEPPNPIYII